METVLQHQKVMRGRMCRSGHGFRVGRLRGSRAALCCGGRRLAATLEVGVSISSHVIFSEKPLYALEKARRVPWRFPTSPAKLYLQSLHSIQEQPSTSTFHTIRSSEYSFYSNCILSPCRPLRNDGSCQRHPIMRRPFQTNHEVSVRLPRSPRETAPQRQLSRRMIMWTPSQLTVLRATRRGRQRTPRKTARPSQHFFLQP